MSFGSVIFGILAWAKFGPIGGIIAYLIGESIPRMGSFFVGNKGEQEIGQGDSSSFSNSGTNTNHRYHNTGTSHDHTAALLVLMAAIMNADNVVRKSELDRVKRFLVSNFGEENAKQMLLRLRDLNGRQIPVAEVCRQIKQNTDYTTRYHILDFLFSIAAADGMIVRAEYLLLNNISSHLGINTGDYLSIKNRHRNAASYEGGYSSFNSSASYGSVNSSSDDGPYSVLGLTSSATDDEVKKAYRRLAMKYHPDRVESLGEEVRRNSEAQFRKINDAYEKIKQARGMK